MSKSILSSLLASVVACGCALPAPDGVPAVLQIDGDAPAVTSPQNREQDPASRGAPVEASAKRGGSQERDKPERDKPEREKPAREKYVDPQSPKAMLEIWNDPKFQRRFAESFLAESEIEPRATVIEAEALQEVMELIGADRIDEAMATLRELRGEANSALFDYQLANLHFQRDELSQAAEAYRVAVEKFPKFRRAWKNLGIIQVRDSRFVEAMESFGRVIELGGGDAVSYGLLGFACSSSGDDLAAESAYRMANLLDPATLDWQMGLARSFFRQKRFADAAALCGVLIERHPDRADLWLLQGNAYVGMEQPLLAAKNLEFVDQLGKATPDSLNLLGDIYVSLELFGQATDSYVRAMERAPAVAPQRALRAARVLLGRGALDDAQRLVERIAALFPDQLEGTDRKDLLKLRARLAVARGAGEDEAKVLEEIVALDPLDGEALLLLGQHAQRGGDLERAVFWYERAASLEAFEADAKVRHGQVLVARGRYADALPLLRRAQAIKPRDNVAEYLEQVERVAQTR